MYSEAGLDSRVNIYMDSQVPLKALTGQEAGSILVQCPGGGIGMPLLTYSIGLIDV